MDLVVGARPNLHKQHFQVMTDCYYQGRDISDVPRLQYPFKFKHIHFIEDKASVIVLAGDVHYNVFLINR